MNITPEQQQRLIYMQTCRNCYHLAEAHRYGQCNMRDPGGFEWCDCKKLKRPTATAKVVK